MKTTSTEFTNIHSFAMPEIEQSEIQENQPSQLDHLERAKKAKIAKRDLAQKTAKKGTGKIAGEVIINWALGLSATIFLLPVSVIVLDVYWFVTLSPGGINLAKLGWIRGGLVVILNLIFIFFLISFFAVFYCFTNPFTCGLEAAKSVVN